MEAVRAADRDRYLAALYAPEDKRDGAVCALRLQRRDRRASATASASRCRAKSGCNGGAMSSPKDAAPAAAIRSPRRCSQRSHATACRDEPFDNYLEARIFDLYDDPMPSRTELEGYCGETASALIQLAALMLDPDAAPALRRTGRAMPAARRRSPGCCGCCRCIARAASATCRATCSPPPARRPRRSSPATAGRARRARSRR